MRIFFVVKFEQLHNSRVNKFNQRQKNDILEFSTFFIKVATKTSVFRLGMAPILCMWRQELNEKKEKTKDIYIEVFIRILSIGKKPEVMNNMNNFI